MSTTTLKLPFKRFVAQVSSAPARSKSSYLALMAENLEALKKCPWREAAAVPVSLTGHDFTASTQFSDAYDAFKLTGNYETANMTEIAYAGMAAYRFKIPESAMTGSVPVASVSLPVSRDRFLKDGLHVAAAFSTSAEPSADWETVRGSGALAASSVLAQSAATLMEGSADATTVTLDLSGVSSGNPAAYLWVYVTLEDYTDHWTKYNAKEKRLHAVEGSAMLAGDGAEVAFDGTVTADGSVAAKYRTSPIPVRVTYWDYRSMPKLRFRTLHWLGYGDLRHLAPTGEWSIAAGTSDFPFVCDLPTAGRRIPEGDDFVLECWIDEGGGAFKPGMPYGCAVQISDSMSFPVMDRADIELTRTSPVTVRIDLAAAISAATFDGANAATDRAKFNRLWGYGANTPLPDGVESDVSGFNSTSLTRVRVVRQNINDVSTSHDVLLDSLFDLSARPTMTEADVFMGAVSPDAARPALDWGTLNRAFNGSATPSVSLKTASYRLEIGGGEVGSNILPICFVNRFEPATAQPTTIPDPQLADMVYADRPMFRWSHTSSIYKSFPGFRVQIYTDAAKENMVYDSGPMRAPVRDANGMYEWTAPISVGTEGHNGHVFTSSQDYYWLVSMLDDKFTGVGAGETPTHFTFAAS